MNFSKLHPKISTSHFIEGKIRAKKLHDYLQKCNLPKIVWISEDATGILPKIEYDNVSSQLIGQVLPINPNTGNPIEKAYVARSYAEIKKHVSNAAAPKATLAYIVVAQALDGKAAPFIISIHGTVNKFNSEHVLNR